MTFEERKRATETIIDWITEYRGSDLATYWEWERTPMPCGLPLDEQLDEGLALALGDA